METTRLKTDDRLNAFDFDYWRQLAEKHPESFEDQRNRAVRHLIDSSPAALRTRLRGLQWRIDMEMGRGKNPMDRCVRIHRMMMNSVYAPGGLIEAVRNLAGPGDYRSQPVDPAAVIIPFPRRSEG